ncbi:MAG: hypothetical protein MUF42_09190 [Cytophagaceae bacterium]|jgi:hypothetical protein|nr:hypothetical protein [Cytophagaceae bacterium]
MQQSLRIKILAAVLIITASWAAWILIDVQTSDTTSYDRIALDTSGVVSITIQSDSMLTELNLSNPWMVNQRYLVRKELVQLLLLASTRLEIKRPVAAENKARVMSLLTTKGYQLRFNKTLQGTFAANENDANSSYFLKAGDQQPYVVHVPGFTGSITELLKQKEEIWRNRDLFRCSPMSLVKIALRFKAFPASSFEIKNVRPQEFELSGVPVPDSSKFVLYLEQFQEVLIDQYITEGKELLRKQLQQQEPVCVLEVQDLNPASSQTLLIYGPTPKRDAVYCLLKERDELVTLSTKTLERIVVRKEFFLPKK